jgi:uncharacterized membrane protein
MLNLKKRSPRPFEQPNEAEGTSPGRAHASWIPFLLVVAAFLGMVDAAYVALHSSQNFIIPCGFAGGCDQVLNSPYSKLLGIPVAWFGMLFYAAVAGSGLLALFGFAQTLRLSLVVVSLAFLLTLYLLYLQAWVIKAFCDYCLLSALLVTVLLGLHLWRKPWQRARKGH